MSHLVLMPRLGANIDEATVASWFLKEGERVEKGEPLVAVETEKASFELTAEESGVLRYIAVKPGETVPYNVPLAIIAGLDEDVEAEIATIAEHRITASREHVRQMDESVFDADDAAPPVVTAEKSDHRRPLGTPKALRLATAEGISTDSLEALARAQPRGLVSERTVREYLALLPTYIYGASTGAKQILEIIASGIAMRVVAVIDDNAELHGRTVRGLQVIGGIETLVGRSAQGPLAVLVASHSNNRRKIFIKLADRVPQAALPPIVDRRATILADVVLGDGALIEAGCVLGHEVSIGRGAILNLGAKLSHNCVVGDFTHLAIGTSVSGAVTIGANCLIGAGAAINPAVTINDNVIIAPGAAVMNDVPSDKTVSGNPARVIGTSKRNA